MKVLFWVPPWAVNGDYNFFSGAVEKHLMLQANVLAEQGEDVSIVLPSQFSSLKDKVSPLVKAILLPFDFSHKSIYSHKDVYAEFYKGNEELVEQAKSDLSVYLDEDYDAVLLWETPVPFLSKMMPKATIINQMPGIFSRPPYPHTVIFDSTGLYKNGALSKYSAQIQSSAPSEEGLLTVEAFIDKAKKAISAYQPYQHIISEQPKDKELVLLPLQTSGHYAFKVDTGFNDQLHYLDEAVKGSSKTHVVTQYLSRFISDAPINESNYKQIKEKHPNVYYSDEFGKLDTPSQYLIPLVDEIKTASSSIGVQGMIWNKKLSVVGETFLEGYDSSVNLGQINWEQRCKNTLSFCLNNHQPLAKKVTQDGKFLVNLIEAHISKKSHSNSALSVDFETVSPGYSKELISSFRVSVAEKSVAKVTGNSEKFRVLSEFRKLVANPYIKAISFDVFDTLIKRPVEKPADLFKFLEDGVLKISSGAAVDFGKHRTMCEVQAREEFADKEEISLNDIYSVLQSFYGLSDDVKQKIMDYEIESEIACVSQRDMGRMLFDIAQDSGKEIHLISDMYLDESVVKKMVEKCGYEDYKTLYVSVNVQARKHSGKMYDIFLEQQGLKPSELLHVGDNKKTDINMAKDRGVNAFRWSSAIEWMRVNPILKSIYHPRQGAGEKPRSAIAGLTSHKFFDLPVSKDELASLTNGTPYSLGYKVVGPLVLGYVKWIASQSKKSQNSKLFFMAREGLVLKQVYDTLYSNNPEYPESEYLYGSRRVVRVANLRTSSDLASLISSPYDPGVPLSSLINSRFGLDFNAEVESVFAKNGIDESFELTRSFEHRKLFIQVCKDLEILILKNAEQERTSYMKYLESVGFLNEERPSIVDVGWKANIQGAMGELTGKQLDGYYYATLQDSEKWLSQGHKHFAYYGTNISPSISSSTLVQNRHLAEFLLCAPHKSIVKVQENNEGFVPAYRNECDYENRKKLISQIHSAAIDFAMDYKEHFGSYMETVSIPPELAERAFGVYATRPTATDASILVNQSFEDAVGGISQKFILSTGPLSESVWKKGHEAFAKRKPAPKKVNEKKTNPNKEVTKLIDDAKPKTTNGALITIERIITKPFLSTKKYEKLQNNRAAFFLDSKTSLLHKYYGVTSNG